MKREPPSSPGVVSIRSRVPVGLCSLNSARSSSPRDDPLWSSVAVRLRYQATGVPCLWHGACAVATGPKTKESRMAMNQQRTTVVGVFDSREPAERAVDELQRAGFRQDQIGFAMRGGGDV